MLGGDGMNYSYKNDLDLMFFNNGYIYNEAKVSTKEKIEIAKILKDSDLLDSELNDLIKKVIDILEKECDSSIITLVDYEINRNTSFATSLISNIKHTIDNYTKFFDKYGKIIPNLKKYVKCFICLDLITTSNLEELDKAGLDIIKDLLKKVTKA